jgi:hypothetical protein
MAPSIWGKVKTNVQFFAILFAIVRPDVVILGTYLDEWGMVLAAIITVGSAIDYIAGFASALRAPPVVEPVPPELAETPENVTAAARLAAPPRLHSR